MQDTRGRCIKHLHRMSELAQALQAAPEEDRLRSLSSFKELVGLLARQKAIDERNAGADVKRANAQMVSQKRACSIGNESRIKHLRQKIATTATIDDRLPLEEVLQTLENLSVDDECKWDVNIMTHWFNAFKDQREEEPASTPAADAAGPDTSVAVPPSTGVPGEEEEEEDLEVDDISTPEPEAVAPSTGVPGETEEGTVSSVMQAYDSEVVRFVTGQLLRAEAEIESLRKQHLASFSSDIDNTLRVIATVASNIDVAEIKAKVLAARSDGRNQTDSALGTLLDTVQQQFERDPDESNREWWHMLIKSVTVLRDFNYKRNALLSERTKLVVQDMDDQRDAIVARSKAIARSASTLRNKDTRLYVAGIVDDIVRRLHS